MNLRADFTLRDAMAIIRRIQEEDNQLSTGQKNIAFKFSADYVLNDRFTVRFFWDQSIINPRVSTAFRTSNTKVGFSIRFNLIPQ